MSHYQIQTDWEETDPTEVSFIKNKPEMIKFSLTTGDIQNAGTTAIALPLAASGVGYFYRITQANLKLNFGTTPFTSQVLYIGATSILGQYQVACPALSEPQSIITSMFQGIGTVFENSGFAENDTLSVFADSDSLVGDSTIDLYLTVEKVAL